MSTLFVIYVPVKDPEAFIKEDDIYVKDITRKVTVSTLYTRYLEKMRGRYGAENAAPEAPPDNPSLPPGKEELAFYLDPVAKNKYSSAVPQAKLSGVSVKSVGLEFTKKALEHKKIMQMLSTAGLASPTAGDLISTAPRYSDKVKDSITSTDILVSPKQSQESQAEPEKQPETLKEVLIKIITSEKITNVTWRLTENLALWKVTFIADSMVSDLVLNSLITFGFGKITGTSISGGDEKVSVPDDGGAREIDERTEFAKSVKARLTVAQVLGTVKTNACLTFDFMVLIVAASFVAAIGLVENSAVCIVAAMLISPLMGPAIGITFGICIKSAELWKLAAKNECIGLAFCSVFGYIYGLITAMINREGSKWGSSDNWPTNEMRDRGLLRSLWIGCLTAIASGVGIALSILGGNVGSLVGVAISASILPPTVNAGMLWGHATVWAIHEPAYDHEKPQTLQFTNATCSSLRDNTYKFEYNCQAHLEMIILGFVSLALTAINIFCIFIAAIAVLKIKEVAPHVSIIGTETDTDVFWRSHIPMIRHEAKAVRDFDMSNMATQFVEEYQSLKEEEEKKQMVEKWKTIINNLDYDPVYSHTTQHIRRTLPELFVELSKQDVDSLTQKYLTKYTKQPEEEDRKESVDHSRFLGSFGHRVLGWFSETEARPEAPSPPTVEAEQHTQQEAEQHTQQEAEHQPQQTTRRTTVWTPSTYISSIRTHLHSRPAP